MLALLTALSLVAAAPTPAPAFQAANLSDVHLLEGAGGELTAGRGFAFVGLSALGAGASLVAGLPLISGVAEPFGSILLVLPVAATVALQVGLGALFDLDVSWASASIGTLFGVATGAATGLLFSRLLSSGQGGFEDLGLLLVGLVVGFAVGAPVFTLIDPFGLGGGDDGQASLRPTLDAPPVAVGTGVTLWGRRF